MDKWWITEPWRMVQTNLRETDFLDMDAEKYAEDALNLGATVVMVSTSGIVANYPTKLPYQYRNPYVSDTALNRLVQTCHDHGLRVIGRMDFSKVREPISFMHPEWRFVGENGQHVTYNGDTHVCCNSEYQRRLSLNILKETLEMVPLDGVFFNFGGYTSGYDYSGNLYGDCVCENCQRRFYEMFGLELPKHPSDSPYYETFKRLTLEEAHRNVRDLISSLNPNVCIANDFYSGEGFYRAEAGSGLREGDWHYSASDLSSRARTGYPSMRASITSVDFIDIPYRYASPNEERQKHRLAESIAHGGSPDLYIMGRLDNRENQAGIHAARKFFHWHRSHETVLSNCVSKGEILLVRPEAPIFVASNSIDEYKGWFEFLSQSHYLFNSVDESRLYHLSLAPYRTVIYPAARISKVDELLLLRFVKEGGHLLVTACGEKVPNWLGVNCIEKWTEDTRGAYISYPISEGDGVSVAPIIGGYAHCQYGSDVFFRQATIAPHPYGPPERCYYTSISNEPAYTVREYGAGKIVWIPWLSGMSYLKSKIETLTNWMKNVLCGEFHCMPLVTNAPPCLEIVLAKTGTNELILSFINGSGDIGGVWMRPLPLGKIQVALPVSGECKPRGLDDEDIVWSQQGGVLNLSVAIDKLMTTLLIQSAETLH